MKRVIWIIFIFNQILWANEAPELNATNLAKWSKLKKEAIAGESQSLHSILSYPAKNILKNQKAYEYRRILIDILRENTSFLLSESYKYFDKNPTCLLSWLMFYKNEKLMSYDKFEKITKNSRTPSNIQNEYLTYAHSFYKTEDFSFNTKDCKNFPFREIK